MIDQAAHDVTVLVTGRALTTDNNAVFIQVSASRAIYRQFSMLDTSRRDPESDPNMLLLHSAQEGDIAGIERAVQRGSHILFLENMTGMSVLHFAATCPGPKGTQTVRWALGKGIPWNAANRDAFLPEQIAVMHGNEESANILRE